jgi:hypothetical protein
MLALAAERSPCFHFEEELQRLKMPAGLGYRFSPSIKPVTAEKNTMRFRIIGESAGELSC